MLFNNASLLIIYERLEELLKGRTNTSKWRDTEEREKYVRERWRENSDLLAAVHSSDNPFAGIVDQINSITPADKSTSLFRLSHVATTSAAGIKRYRILVPSCLIIASRYPFLQTFDTIMRELYGTYNEFLEHPLEYYISQIVCKVPVPPRGFFRVILKLGANFKPIAIEQPAMNKLPLLDVNFGLLAKHLSVATTIKVLNAIMLEHRVLFVCNEIEKITTITQSILALMFPFEYQLNYIPVVPEYLIEVVSSPVPYVAGIHKKMQEYAVEINNPYALTIVDVDENTVEFMSLVDGTYASSSEPESFGHFPTHETDKLKRRLLEPWY